MSATELLPQNPDPKLSTGRLALLVGVLWLIGASAAAFALLASRVSSLSLAEMLAVAAGIVLPALMTMFAGAAARDSARARAEATRLADAADRLLNPQQSASEAARRVAMNVRTEIGALEEAVENTLARLREVEGHITRQVSSVNDIADRAKAGANEMITGMEREREELLRISRDLNTQAQAIGNSISRHTNTIAEAAKNAESEVRAADQALDNRISSFGAAAALINDRTQGLASAAQASADSARRLEGALTNALEVLTKAGNLTDAARQSAEAATLAANSSAGAVRESTDRAVEDAQRAAEIIRGEAMSIEREANIALERLREAAEAAREAAQSARAAAEEAPALAPRAQEERYDGSWREARDPLEDRAPPARRAEPAPDPADWSWRDLMSSVDNSAPEPRALGPRREPAAPVPPPRRQATPEPRGPSLPILEEIERAGLHLDEVFSLSGLERIAQRARSGTQARRRAVQDAAPDAARRMSEHLAGNAEAKQEAMRFLSTEGARIADQIGRGRAAMNAEATRAFLLLDAAAG